MFPIAIIDLGSNTIVLNIFQQDHQVSYHESIPAHLIQYVDEDRFMSQKGLTLAHDSIQQYANYLKEQGITNVHILITEPARIHNQAALLEELKDFSFPIYALTGEEEAYYDSLSIQGNYPEEKEWFAFDIGGGSSELIHYHQGQRELYSLPLGCVRLAKEKHSLEDLEQTLHQVTQEKPELRFENAMVMGIGGTIKAIGKILYPEEERPLLCKEELEQLYQSLVQEDSFTLELLKRYVAVSRQHLVVPGLTMVLAIVHHFEISRLQVSPEGVRHGFFLHLIKNS